MADEVCRVPNRGPTHSTPDPEMAEGGSVGRRAMAGEPSRDPPRGSGLTDVANLYLHYAFDLWANQWREKTAQGDMIVVRYADDMVLGFERRKEAEAFLEQMGERMRKFGLELHAEKTRLIEFGRYAAENRERRGEGRPETFNFLGFTHRCEKARRGGWFKVQRQTIKKRWRSKLQAVKQKLRQRMHEKVTVTGKWLKSVVLGYVN